MGAAKLYCMTSLQDGWLVKNLSEKEARAIFSVLSVEERLVTRLWTEDWPGWLSIDTPQCSFLFVPREQSQTPPPSQPEGDEVAEITQVQLPKVLHRQSNTQAIRRHVRFQVQIPVTIQTVSEYFETVTEDVSEGGILLRDALPDKFAGYCQVVFQPRSNLTFVVLATLVEDQRNARSHLEFVEGDQQWQFVEWLRQQSWAQGA